jgi:hypothetical protein
MPDPIAVTVRLLPVRLTLFIVSLEDSTVTNTEFDAKT